MEAKDKISPASDSATITELPGEAWRVSDCHFAEVTNHVVVHDEYDCEPCEGTGKGGLDSDKETCEGCNGTGKGQVVGSSFTCDECGEPCLIHTNPALVALMRENAELRVKLATPEEEAANVRYREIQSEIAEHRKAVEALEREAGQL